MDDKLILQELKAIKRALTCGGSIGGSNSDTNLALDTFQIYNCSEEPVGSPQDVLKTVVLNSITTKICNITELSDAISAPIIESLDADTYISYTTPLKITGVDISNVKHYMYLRHKIINKNKTILTDEIEYSLLGDAFSPAEPVVDIVSYLTDWNFNEEEELIMAVNTTYNIPINSVHSYTITVSGTGTTSTIQISANTPVPIANGYSKSIEFTTTNQSEVNIFCDTNDVIRILKQY